MFSDRLFVEVYTKPGGFRHRDIPVLDYGVGEAGNECVPPSVVYCVILQHQEVFGSCSAVHAGHGGYGCARHMQCHRYAVILGKIPDLFCFQYAT